LANYSGCEGDFTFGGVVMLCNKWTFKDEVTITDVASKSSGGFAYGLGCMRKGSGTFEGYVDSTVHVSDPNKIKAGATGAFELELESGGSSISGSCIIKDVTFDSELTGVTKFSGSFETRGEYYLPGEATS